MAPGLGHLAESAGKREAWLPYDSGTLFGVKHFYKGTHHPKRAQGYHSAAEEEESEGGGGGASRAVCINGHEGTRHMVAYFPHGLKNHIHNII